MWPSWWAAWERARSTTQPSPSQTWRLQRTGSVSDAVGALLAAERMAMQQYVPGLRFMESTMGEKKAGSGP